MRTRPALLAALACALLPAPASAAVHLTQLGSFDQPVHVAVPPGDPERLFAVERTGRIMELRDGAKLDAPFLDIHADVRTTNGEQGLLSMAFAPDYATSRKFYVYYTAPRANDAGGSVLTIVEYTAVAGNPDAVDPASRRVLLTIDHPNNGNHNGGQLQFGPDGMLYAGTGDGGGGNDQPNNAQNPAVQLGKLLRIDPATGAATNYALGLRNPWRFSFDRLSGDLVIGDVGQDLYEEIDFAPAGTPAGANYGWRCFEGFHATTNSCPTPPVNPVPPVIEKDHSSDGYHAIVGGYVVHTPDLPGLAGRYVYGDNASTAIRSAALVAPPARVTDDVETGMRVDGLTSFGQDYCGHVYAASGGGPVYRIDSDTFTPCKAAATPGPPPTPIDTRPPVLRLSLHGPQRVLHNHGVRLGLRCDETCGATVRGNVRVGNAKRRHKLYRATVQVIAGRRARPKLLYTERTRRAIARGLRHHWRVRVSVSVAARDAAGNVARATKTIRARR